MKHTQWILIAFMVISLGAALLNPVPGAVALFAVSNIMYGFHTFLDRKKFDDLDGVKADIHNLQQQLSNIKIGLGW